MCVLRRHRPRHRRRSNAVGAGRPRPGPFSTLPKGPSGARVSETALAGRPPVGGADRKGIMLPALAVLAIVFALSF